jgi:hypothetical protein
MLVILIPAEPRALSFLETSTFPTPCLLDEADDLAVKQDHTVMVRLYNVSRINDMVKLALVTKSTSICLEYLLELTCRCFSYNCESNGKCGRSFDEPVQAPAYAYALIAVGIVLCKSAHVFWNK